MTNEYILLPTVQEFSKRHIFFGLKSKRNVVKRYLDPVDQNPFIDEIWEIYEIKQRSRSKSACHFVLHFFVCTCISFFQLRSSSNQILHAKIRLPRLKRHDVRWRFASCPCKRLQSLKEWDHWTAHQIVHRWSCNILWSEMDRLRNGPYQETETRG